MNYRLLTAICLFAAGCHYALNDKGTDPPAAQLYFPAGIAMDPGGHFLYVSNGNADLRYGGGTVEVIDILSFECTLATFRAEQIDHVADVNAALPDACRYQDLTFWEQAYKNALCQADPVDPTIADCDESGFIMQNSTVGIGNFAGTIRLRKTEGGSADRQLFVAVRGDPSITEVDVHLPSADTVNDPGVLDCFTRDEYATLKQRPQYDPTTHRTSAPPICDVTHMIQDYSCSGLPECMVGTDQNGKTQLPTEPFSIVLDEPRNRLLVSHQTGGEVSVVDIGEKSGDETWSGALKSVSQPFFLPDSTGRHGAFGMAKQHADDPSSLWYLTSNVQPQIATFRLGNSDVVIPQTTFALSATFAQGGDVRDIHFQPDGQRAFVTDANPPTVLVMDTHTVGDLGGEPANIVTDVIDVCQTPSHMGLRRIATYGADGTPVMTTKLVVVCFLSNQVMIVDPDRAAVDDTIFSGFNGPNDVAFNFGNDDDPPGTQVQLAPRHAYVTNYTDSTIAVVDLEPHSPTQNRVIGRLGMPIGGFNP